MTSIKPPPIDPETISPGVRDLVMALRDAGLWTCDSGDGSNYEAGMECALPFHHVFIACHVSEVHEVSRKCHEILRARPELAPWPHTIEPFDEVEGDALSFVAIMEPDPSES